MRATRAKAAPKARPSHRPQRFTFLNSRAPAAAMIRAAGRALMAYRSANAAFTSVTLQNITGTPRLRQSSQIAVLALRRNRAPIPATSNAIDETLPIHCASPVAPADAVPTLKAVSKRQAAWVGNQSFFSPARLGPTKMTQGR